MRCFVSDPREALRMTLELNEMFRQPLNSQTVESATKSAEKAYSNEDKEYKYKNTTLIELLEISEEEQGLGVRKIVKNIGGWGYKWGYTHLYLLMHLF